MSRAVLEGLAQVSRGLTELAGGTVGEAGRAARGLIDSGLAGRLAHPDQLLLGRALLEVSYGAIPPGSELYQQVVRVAGGRYSTIGNYLYKEAALLRAYTAGEVTSFDRENRGSVERMVAWSEELAGPLGLTHRDVHLLRQGMLLSDIGKRMGSVAAGGAIRREMVDFKSFRGPRDLPHRFPRNRYLTGIAAWLRRYQETTEVPLTFSEAALARWNADQLRWGTEPFLMRGRFGSPMTDWDRLQALRLWKIVYPGETQFFPEGLLFHEVIGYMIGSAGGFAREVLDGVAFHNGPEVAMTTSSLGALETYADVTDAARWRPFWGGLTGLLLASPYPMVDARHRLGILHTLFDRWEQGQMSEIDGALHGGPRKILGQILTAQGGDVRTALIEAASVSPSTAEQVHALWFHRIAGGPFEASLRPVYEAVIARLKAAEEVFNVIDWGNLGPYHVAFHGGEPIDVPPQFLPSTTKLDPEVAGTFLDRLFRRLSSRTSSGGASGRPAADPPSS